MTENIIYTPSTIFPPFEDNTDAETEITGESDYGGVKFNEINFYSEPSGTSRPKGYGVLASSPESNLAPLLIIIGNILNNIDKDLMAYFASQNFNVFMFDYCGDDGKKEKYTVYPAETDYANLSRAGRHFKYADTTARETCYYRWALLARGAICAAKKLCEPDVPIGIMGIGAGANITWMLASAVKDINAFCTVFSAGWNDYDGVYKYGENGGAIAIDEERERWLAGIAAESYAKFLSSPMLFISSSNCRLTHMERAYDTLSRVPGNETFCCITPRFSDFIGLKYTKNILLYFKKYLCGEDISLPDKFSCTVENREGKAAITLTGNKSAEISRISIFYCEGEINPCARNWHEINAAADGETYTVYPKVNFEESLLFAYAEITYKNGFVVSSNLCVKKIKELGVSLPPFRRLPVLYNSVMEKDCFTAHSLKPLKLSEVFLEDYFVSLKQGPGGIYGVTAVKGSLATYKAGDISFKGIDDESFKFDVYSANQQELKVYFRENAGTASEHCHFYTIKLLGGNIWQPVEIKKQNLKSAEGIILKSWQGISMAGFEAPEEFLINNILWL